MSIVWINGEERDVEALTIVQLTERLGMSPATLVEYNGKALYRSEWPTTHIRSGDRIELLQITAGG